VTVAVVVDALVVGFVAGGSFLSGAFYQYKT